MSEATTDDGKARVARYYAAREQFRSGRDGPELDALTVRYEAREARRAARVSAEIRAIVRQVNKQRTKRK